MSYAWEEYDLEAGASITRYLIRRSLNINTDTGIPYDKPGVWERVAHFDSYNEAERVLGYIRAALREDRTLDPRPESR